jgi:cytochrome c-type biogenesis protein CcmH
MMLNWRLLSLGNNQSSVIGLGSNGTLLGLFSLVPILAVPLYLQFGQPDYPDQNFATRPDQEAIMVQRELNGLMARVEKRLAEMPEDAQGWALVAPIYYRSGRVDDALNAYAKAVQFHKGDAISRSQLLADRAEILVVQTEGKVTPEIAADFSKALDFDPDNQKAVFYNAIGLEQNGDATNAKTNWQLVITRFEGANPTWLAVAKQRLAGLSDGGTAPAVTPATGTSPLKGPNSDDVAAAKDMTPEQQQKMIKSMVDSLAARLAENPKDSDGWRMLIRSRHVSGDQAQAVKDLVTARSNFVEGSEGRAAIDALATELGI